MAGRLFCAKRMTGETPRDTTTLQFAKPSEFEAGTAIVLARLGRHGEREGKRSDARTRSCRRPAHFENCRSNLVRMVGNERPADTVRRGVIILRTWQLFLCVAHPYHANQRALCGWRKCDVTIVSKQRFPAGPDHPSRNVGLAQAVLAAPVPGNCHCDRCN